MDSRLSAQDVVRCDQCKDNVVESYCDVCHVKLCKPCIGGHISDGYDKHIIVSFHQRKSTLIFPICKTHSTETCKLECISCTIFICAKCSISEEHKGHDIKDLEDIYNSKKANIEFDAEEFETVISPTYEEITKELESQIAGLDGEYEKLTKLISKQGEELHDKIDAVIDQMKHEIDVIKEDHQDILKKHLKEIKEIESLIIENLGTLKDIQRESNMVSKVMEYKSRNNDFKKLPPKVHVLLPSFCPNQMEKEKVENLIGSITPLISTIEENGYTLKKQKMPYRELLDASEVINAFNTGYKYLRSISFYSMDEIWTCGQGSKIKCFNMNGNSINAIKTKSGEEPDDIAVTSDGCLLYSDRKTKTINKVMNGQIERLIKLQKWTPTYLCVTSSRDLLVGMSHEFKSQNKIVRYSGAVEKQTIKYDEDNTFLYSRENGAKYITENKNLDICVADRAAGAVVVVNQSGKLRFRYKNHHFKENPFIPRGITTNSQSQILTADLSNLCIHILDQDGQFLNYINFTSINEPGGLCVDTLDNLFVAEYKTGDVKVIKYLK